MFIYFNHDHFSKEVHDQTDDRTSLLTNVISLPTKSNKSVADPQGVPTSSPAPSIMSRVQSAEAKFDLATEALSATVVAKVTDKCKVGPPCSYWIGITCKQTRHSMKNLWSFPGS